MFSSSAVCSRKMCNNYFQCSCLQNLLAEGVAVDARTPQGETPLFFASQNGHISVMNLLISKGVLALVSICFSEKKNVLGSGKNCSIIH